MQIRLALLLLLISSCGMEPSYAFSKKAPAPEPNPIVTAMPVKDPPWIPKPADLSLRFVPQYPMYATESERQMIETAAQMAIDTLRSDCFKNFISHRHLIQTNNRTPAQVAEHLQGLMGVVPVEMYYRCMSFGLSCLKPTSAVAYRNPGSPTIHLNRASFTEARPLKEWAGTLAHEAFGHALGQYDHDFYWNASRDFSVPYSISGASLANKDAFQACLP